MVSAWRRSRRELLEQHELAFGNKIVANLPLDAGGDLYWRRDGELHQWNPATVGQLQYAVRTGNYEAYREFANYLNDQDQRLQTIRGLLDFDIDEHDSIPINEVEAVEEIWKRFSTGSMSHGALSTEAHEALAIAMNRIGGKAGTGEGGEQVERFGTERECSMKQVASGRFGRNDQLFGPRKADRNKDGSRGQAGGRRGIAWTKGDRRNRCGALHHSWRGSDLSAAASRYLLDRGSGAVDS